MREREGVGTEERGEMDDQASQCLECIYYQREMPFEAKAVRDLCLCVGSF